MCTWSKTDDQDPRLFDTESGDGSAPILLVLVRLPLRLRDLFTPGYEARTCLTLDESATKRCK
jgi:hypothetical protein